MAPEPTVRKSRRGPLLVAVIFAACAVAILLVRGSDTLDHAIANILTLVLAFVAAVSLLVWFSFFSGLPRGMRLTPLVLLGSTLAVAVATLEIDHVWGELVPVFKLRWTKKPDQLLEKPPAGAIEPSVDLETTTAADYPRFLGPDLAMNVRGLALDRDWQAHPPKPLWRHAIGAGWSSFAIVNGYAVTLEQRGDDELVTCYNVRSGKLEWSHAEQARHSTKLGGVGPRSTPTIDSGKVYSLGATGIFCCLDGVSGALLWKHDLLREYGAITGEEDQKSVAWGRAASPLIVDDLVVIPAGGRAGGPYVSLVAINKETGEKVWQAGDRQVSYSSPRLATICGVRQILIVNENNITAHDPSSGRTLWDYPWPGNSNTDANSSQAVPLPGDRVFISKGYSAGGGLFQVRHTDDKWSTETIWQDAKAMKTKFTNVAILDGCVYGLSDGILECIDLDTGKRRWKKGRYGHGQILRCGDLLLIQAETGEVALVEVSPERYHELGRFAALDGQTWNNPALSGRLLLVRNGEEAACYELPLAETQK